MERCSACFMADNATRLNEQAANLRDVVVSARATAQDALLNLLQSSGANFQGGAKLSAATKAAMGKRGLNQVEVLKGALDRTVEEADMLVKDADCLRAEVKATLKVSREAVDAAEAAKCAHEEGLADAQAEVTRRTAAMGEKRAAACANVHSNAECEAWAGAGQCDANPGFMHLHCAAACAACATLDAADSQGYSPLVSAVIDEQEATVAALLTAGATVGAALHWACALGRSPSPSP